MSVLTRVQTNPEIGTARSDYVAELVARVEQFIADYCRLPRFPESAKGYAKSGLNPSTDISSLGADSLLVAVNGSAFAPVTLTLASCTTGANTASELQTQIRAAGNVEFEEVTLTYTGTSPNDYYLIESGKYGEDSRVDVSFIADEPDVARALKLSTAYDGTEELGSNPVAALEDAAVTLVEQWYRKLGVEGAQRADVPGGPALTLHGVDPQVLAVLQRYRRLA